MEQESFNILFKFVSLVAFAYAGYTHKQILEVRKEAKDNVQKIENELKQALKKIEIDLQSLTILANKSPDERWVNSTIKIETDSLKVDFKKDVEALSKDVKGLNNSVISLIATMQAKSNE